jgi:hypothetical protein
VAGSTLTRPSRKLRLSGSCVAAFMFLSVLQGCSSEDISVVGTWRPTDVATIEVPENFSLETTSLTFESDGSWTAQTGCPQTDHGKYRLDGDDLSFSSENIDAGCGNFDIPWDELLLDADSVKRDDDLLTLYDGDGSTIAELEKSGD